MKAGQKNLLKKKYIPKVCAELMHLPSVALGKRGSASTIKSSFKKRNPTIENK